jgi:hypothetical protein
LRVEGREGEAGAKGGTHRTKAVVVAGMHRCGTSLTASIIETLGVDLGSEDTRIPAGFDNRQGFQEQEALVAVSDEILATLGGTWYKPPELPLGWVNTEPISALRSSGSKAIRAAGFKTRGPWGWKDPRLSLTLPFWLDLVPRSRCIICVRNPADVVVSLIAREPNTHTPESALELWVRYLAKAVEHTLDMPSLLVLYEDYFDQPRVEIERVARFVGISNGDLAAETMDAAARVIDRKLRHHASDPLDEPAMGPLRFSARLLYGALVAARRLDAGTDGAEASAPADPVDLLGRAAADAWESVEEWRRVLNESGRKASRLEAAAQEGQVELRRVSGDLDRLRKENYDLVRRHEGSRHELQSTREKLGVSERKLRDSEEKLESARAELEKLTSVLAKRDAALKAARADASDSAKRFRSKRSALARARTAVEKRDSELGRAQSQLSQSRAEVDALRAQLEDAQSELARTGRELNAAHARLSRIEAQLPRRIARRLRGDEGAEAPQ